VCTRLATASDTVYQLLAHGRWFSPGSPASSTTKTNPHIIAEILLKVALNTINQIKSNPIDEIRISQFCGPSQRTYVGCTSIVLGTAESFYQQSVLWSKSCLPFATISHMPLDVLFR
jgi:hypothetical protein